MTKRSIHDPAPASLHIAEACLEQVGNASTSEEGAEYATVAGAYALVVLTKTVDHQNYLLASVARTLESVERHLSLLAEHVVAQSSGLPHGPAVDWVKAEAARPRQ